ncbi:MAG TPA: hypothetical protein VEX68_20610 [Bryobacteraceae bacterium]|nr:hypothetical protein [Bryobacteraceae bacterium]
MKRSHINVILSLLAVFGSGIAVGAFAYHSYSTKTVSARVDGPVRRDPQEWRRQYLEEISSRLQLDPTQLGHLNGILDETRARFKGLKERHKKEIDEVKSAQTEQIKSILTPAQKPEFDKFREERERRMKEAAAAREQAAKH